MIRDKLDTWCPNGPPGLGLADPEMTQHLKAPAPTRLGEVCRGLPDGVIAWRRKRSSAWAMPSLSLLGRAELVPVVPAFAEEQHSSLPVPLVARAALMEGRR